MTPDAILSRLLYKDSLMLVLNKPAGLPVHAGPKGGDNLEMFLDPLRFGLPRLPSLAHRLDRDTSAALFSAAMPRRYASWASCFNRDGWGKPIGR